MKTGLSLRNIFRGGSWYLRSWMPLFFVIHKVYCQDVSAEGYVMDRLCIDLGVLLDNQNIASLERPDLHTVHCLADISSCINSGFTLLGDPQNNGGLYSVMYAFTESSNEALLELMRLEGSCSTCYGGGSIRAGFRVKIEGTIVDSESDPPVVDVVEWNVVVDDPRSCFLGLCC